jgi:uncharacterized protein
LELFITEDCNLACDYCFVKGKNPRMMPLETMLTAINFLSFYSGNQKEVNLTLFGGEPLMAKKTVCKIVEHIRFLEQDSGTKRFHISMTTNGTLLDEAFLKLTHDKIQFLLSIDGDRETHDMFRRYKNGKGTFATVKSKIGLLKKYQPWVGARMTVLPKTAAGLYQNVAGLFEAGINQVMIGPAMDMEWDKESLKTYERQLKFVGDFYKQKIAEKKPFRMTLFEQHDNGSQCHEQQWGCGAGRNTISVTTDGDIYPCSKFIGYEEFDAPELILGNIYEGITNIELRKSLTKLTDASFPHCASCSEINACKGGCPADNYFLHRDTLKPGHTHCEIKKIENRILKQMPYNT